MINIVNSDWDNVWSRKTFLTKIVDLGRKIYNFYFISLIKDNIKTGKLLEIGCGTSSAIKKIKELDQVIGIDISREAMKISNKDKNQNNAFIRGDCFKLPIADNTFDLVWSQGLIEHFSEPDKIVNEHYRVCKNGGIMLISVPYKYSYTLIWWYLTRPKFLRSLWPWTDQEFYTKRKFMKIIDKQGIKNHEFLTNYIFGTLILKVIKYEY